MAQSPDPRYFYKYHIEFDPELTKIRSASLEFRSGTPTQNWDEMKKEVVVICTPLTS